VVKREPASSLGAADGPPKTDARLGKLVRLLQDHTMVMVSGTKVADDMGISRSEVWRLVHELRSLGVEVEGRPATGYRLIKMPDLLLPAVLARMVQGTIFAQNICHYFKVSSTNTAALEAAGAGAPEGSVFVAEQQTAGRGRGVHEWESQKSVGIYCSVILRPTLPPSEMLPLSLATGLAVDAAVRELDPDSHPDLKWPNDLLIHGKKFGGILTEMNAEPTRVRYAVVGIGINVNQANFLSDLEPIATSLRLASGREWSRVELCAAVLRALGEEYRKLVKEPNARADILERFQYHSSTVKGRRVHVEENGGYDGVTEGLDERGFLRVRTEAGVRTVLSATVRPK
jgi:BirA family biotin operon repressor/biotin-[acetyl-CoA-carboxylase] ligase